MELICFGNRKEKICLKFYPYLNSGNNVSWEEWHNKEPLVVFITDYKELLLNYLNAIFPLTNPINGELQEYFDVCFDNWADIIVANGNL